MLAKQLEYLGGAQLAGIVLGARVPTILTSRADSAETRLTSCAVAVLLFPLAHECGPHFRDYHLLLDEQADQIFAITDDIAERVRKVGGTTIRSVGHIARLQRLTDNDQEFVPSPRHAPRTPLRQQSAWSKACARRTRSPSKANDYATTSLIEVWIDEAERRAWFLFESTR
jgi:starvation-inducible DNA-binding protein